jgi:hypothetical protein
MRLLRLSRSRLLEMTLGIRAQGKVGYLPALRNWEQGEAAAGRTEGVYLHAIAIEAHALCGTARQSCSISALERARPH